MQTTLVQTDVCVSGVQFMEHLFTLCFGLSVQVMLVQKQHKPLMNQNLIFQYNKNKYTS